MTTASPGPEDSTRLLDFVRYFDLSVANSQAQRAKVYELRYRVYCEEFGYEPTDLFTNHQEMDEFDSHSVHCLVTHRSTGITAGCVRVVLVDGSERMPMECHADHSINQRIIQSFSGQRNTLCEISRLAVGGEFRRRRGEWETRYGNTHFLSVSHRERRTFPLIAMFLFIAAAAVAMLLNRKNCFAIMEPFLPKLLKRNGIHFQRIGEDFNFRGLRAPYYGNLDELVDQAPEDLRQSFFAVCDEFTNLLPMPMAIPKASRTLDNNFRFPRWWLNATGYCA